MSLFKFSLLCLTALALVNSTLAVYTQLQSDVSCGPKQIELYENDIQPMVSLGFRLE